MENEVMHIKLKFKEGLKHYIHINDIDSVITDDRWIKKWQNINCVTRNEMSEAVNKTVWII